MFTMFHPELALMGSCVLAVQTKGEDVYIMNVRDSQAVLGKKSEIKDLQRISEDGEGFRASSTLDAIQLTLDHSTGVEEEVRRIKREHPEDACAVMNDRVKGSLKVTRAFGAGFLKQYFTNEEVVAEVESFIATMPEGDPAQHLVEEFIFRAARKAGVIAFVFQGYGGGVAASILSSSGYKKTHLQLLKAFNV
ncbi:probable protein phosphatase 2C 23 isoform X2 [Asparagus officinalis]|uniref:probable protein phosphatase 2C 23 isoform X2 n=1 Tax=Asparagus officinalis TaxID=4686 RepID=UPI00098E5F5B|nr:probable protein phosphatase 2C 23 isoform X2 [Asparagus officinalis]